MNKKCKVALWQGFPHSPRFFRRTINRILTSDCGLPEPMVMLRFWIWDSLYSRYEIIGSHT